MKRKVLRPHIVLCISGRLFILLCIGFPLYFLYITIRGCLLHPTLWPVILLCIGLIVLAVWIVSIFWQQIWGKLIFKADCLIWRCLFCRPVRINYSEIGMVVIRNFGNRNVVKADLYQTGFRFVLISKSCALPQKPIDKIKCKQGLVKWQIFESNLPVLREHLPERWKGAIK